MWKSQNLPPSTHLDRTQVGTNIPPLERKSVLVSSPLLHLFSGLDSLPHGSGTKGPLLRPDDGVLSPC